ncbi:MAG: helix-turn-helix transcriptional regulator [Desulfobulbaceae bacterium]|nr:helix-turn-helix transcriptional regulator [Desulfobulbaceae bacterium]
MRDVYGNFFAELGFAFRRRRIALRMRQTELAARSGVSRYTLMAIEKGSDSVSIGAWFAVAKALGLDGSWGQLMTIPVDPFAEFDRRQEARVAVTTARVRRKRQ